MAVLSSFWMIVMLSVVEIYGDFALRFYAQTDKLAYLAHGIAGYVGVVYFLIQSLRLKNVLYVNGMWDGISGIMESAAAYVFLGDRLDKPMEYLGLVAPSKILGIDDIEMKVLHRFGISKINLSTGRITDLLTYSTLQNTHRSNDGCIRR